MVHVASGEWYCATHGLQLAVKHLVSLCREREANSDTIAEIIGKELPELVKRIEGLELTTAS